MQPRAAAASDVDKLVAEFKQFIAERVSWADVKKDRVAQAVAFLNNEFVARHKLRQRILFLQRKGFGSDEIEDALEQVDSGDYLRFLENRWDEKAEKAAALISEKQATEDHQPHAADVEGTGGQQQDHPHGYWRIGSTVYAYKGDCSYYPVPLLGFDYSRIEDIIKVSHQLPSGEYGPPQFYPAGFKGVVPDEYCPWEAVHVGVTVIAEYPKSFRNHLKEAVVIRKSDKNADEDYTVDLEWVHTSEVAHDVDFRSFRLLRHPKMVLDEIEEEEYRRKNIGTVDRVASASSFRVLGQPQISSAEEGRQVLRTEEEDRFHMTSHFRNFIKYPHLDGDQPRGIKTGTSFVSQYGEAIGSDNRKKRFPLCPQSQVEQSSLGFGFNLTRYERHPNSRSHIWHNPILDIAEQCLARETMFVDPDFPPSFRSLYGAQAEEFIGTAQQAKKILSMDEEPKRLIWRRASETMFRPRLQVIGSKPKDMVPGDFTPVWLINALSTLSVTAEFEDMISPGEDGWIYGAYVVRLFIDGRWAFVVVDDFLPCDAETNRPVSVISGNPNEIYPCIIEKALAKLEGSYASLKQNAKPWLTLGRIWEDISSNTMEYIDHDLIPSKDAVNSNLQETVKRDSNSCQIHARCRGDDPRDQELGFEADAYWYVDAIAQYLHPARQQTFYYYHVSRAPELGSEVKQVDAKREKFFQMMPPEAIDCFPDVPENSVSYWIPSSDYFRIFDRTALLWYFNNSQKAAFEGTFAGRECAGKMAGPEQWLRCPQLMLRFVQPSNVIIEFKLLDRRIRREAPYHGHAMQIHLLKGKPTAEPLTAEEGEGVIAASPMANLLDDLESRNHPSTTIRLAIASGNYIAIPSLGPLAADCGAEGYVVKVFSVAAFDVRLVN